MNERQRATGRKARALHATHVGHAGNLKGTGKLGTNLGRIAIHRHLAADEQVEVLVERLDAAFESIGGCQGIGTCKGAIGQQQRVVGASGDAVAQQRLGRGDAHRHHRHAHIHAKADKVVLQRQRAFQSARIKGINDRLLAIAHDGIGLGVHLDLGAARHRLDAHHHMEIAHLHAPPFWTSSSKSFSENRLPRPSCPSGSSWSLSRADSTMAS